ncbi:hypothetical protein RHGRI_005309 [Rhododendron griersonianum]|uniref:Uncharacterized protein n=1 Tax=Rhododendron griersonianum TaxID=479676 RepID=A0AAV6LDY4_9ERIC|nr:hypothetical protein RHGRI_005309 [Rhododendron griersonianum]
MRDNPETGDGKASSPSFVTRERKGRASGEWASHLGFPDLGKLEKPREEGLEAKFFSVNCPPSGPTSLSRTTPLSLSPFSFFLSYMQFASFFLFSFSFQFTFFFILFYFLFFQFEFFFLFFSSLIKGSSLILGFVK